VAEGPDENQKPPSLLRGAGAGLIASFAGWIAVYLYLCGWTAATTGGDIAVILLSAFTTIPLMMIFVVSLPNALLGVLIGLGLGIIAKLRGSAPRFPVWVLLGVVTSHLIFRNLAPWLFSHRPGESDITVAISSLPFVAVYGALLGALVGKFYGKLTG
jgi:hypothetical protein